MMTMNLLVLALICSLLVIINSSTITTTRHSNIIQKKKLIDSFKLNVKSHVLLIRGGAEYSVGGKRKKQKPTWAYMFKAFFMLVASFPFVLS